MHIKSKNSWLKHFDFILWDIAILYLSFVLANYIYLKRLNYYSSTLYTMVFLCMLIPCVLIDVLYNPFSGILRRDNITEIIKAFEYTLYKIVFSVFLMYLLKLGGVFSRIVFILTYVIFVILIIIVRIIWKKLLISGKVTVFPDSNNSLLIITTIDDKDKILQNIDEEEYRQYNVKGFCIVDVDMSGIKLNEYDVLCNKYDIHKCVVENNIGEIFVSCNPNLVDSKVIQQLVDEGIGIHIDINKIYGIETDEQYLDKVGIYKTLGLGLYTFSPSQSIYLVIKRIIDFILSLIAIIPMFVLIVLVKLAFLLTGDKDKILFKQTRVGQNGKMFELYKIRTMVPNADEELKRLLLDKKIKEEWEEYHKLENDPRITKVGRILRKTSLDEVPQFINVLKGDMSIIGPRPLVEGELKKHNGLKLYERVKPGITGWWACNGRSNISYDERLELEYYYVKNCSLSLDILTFLRTIYVVLKKTGAE